MFFSKIVRWMCGYRKIKFGVGREDLLSSLLKKEIALDDITRCSDGGIEFIISCGGRKKLLSREPEALSEAVEDRLCGLPAVLKRYKKRPGIILGAVIFVLLLKASEMFVWDITVSGNNRIGDAEITAMLEEKGFGIGTFIPGVDLRKLSNSCLIGNDSLSWMAVNLSGTTAQVEVIEKLIPDTSRKNNGAPCNIVASRDGYIVRTEAREGHLEVEPGETVEKGQLLISGIYESGRTEVKEYSFVHASGSVFAETFRVFTVEVPLEIIEKTHYQYKTVSKSIKFFSKTVKIYENSGILSPEYDKIRSVERITLFENSDWLPSVRLPVFIIKEQLAEYRETGRILIENEAKEIALGQLADRVEAELPSAEILERDLSFETADGVLRLTAVIRCVEDIAREQLIGIVGNTEAG